MISKQCLLGAALAVVSGTVSIAQDAAAQTSTPQAQTPPAESAPTTVDEVIVTARQRAEKAQDVPIALTSIKGDSLRRGEFLDVKDINLFSPSTNFVDPTPGAASFSIRGIGANLGNAGLETSAGFFFDGVYLGSSLTAVTDYIDINQIDVLRGPQGTLFGKNTTAGAIVVTTTAPSFTPSATFQGTYGNYNYQQYQATLTGPLISDVLAGEISLYRTTRDGDVADPATGTKVDSVNRDGVRAQLLYRPNSQFNVRLIGEFSDEADSNGVAILTSLGTTPTAYKTKLALVGASVIVDPTGLSTNADTPPSVKIRSRGLSAEANWTSSRGYTLTSITAYRDAYYHTSVDPDLTNQFITVGGTDHYRENQFSQEVRLATPKGPQWDAVVGAYYFQKNTSVTSTNEFGALFPSYALGIPASLIPVYARLSPIIGYYNAYANTRWDTRTAPELKSYALFGQGVYHVTPALSVTFGLRETYETKDETLSQPTPINLTTGAPVAALASTAFGPTQVAISNWGTQGLLSVDYKISRDVMAYGLVSTGEKAGGINGAYPSVSSGLSLSSLIVKPETATNFELGLKSEFFDHRLRINFDAFDTKVTDYQATYIAVPPGGTAAVSLLTNVGGVRSRGVEIDAAAKPVPGLTLTLAASYNDAYYESYPNGPCPIEITSATYCNLTGRPVNQAPHWIINPGFSYVHQLLGSYEGFIDGRYGWKSSRYGYQDDSRYSLLKSVGLLNLDFGLRPNRGGWQISLWAKNLTNEHYVSSLLSYGTLVPGNYPAFFGEPRTYGVTLRVKN